MSVEEFVGWGGGWDGLEVWGAGAGPDAWEMMADEIHKMQIGPRSSTGMSVGEAASWEGGCGALLWAELAVVGAAVGHAPAYAHRGRLGSALKWP